MKRLSYGYTSLEVMDLVKGISRQVIVVHSPDPKLFEQAIFILKENAVGNGGITDEQLMKEAKQLLKEPVKKRKAFMIGPVWACGGAALTGAVWLLSALF